MEKHLRFNSSDFMCDYFQRHDVEEFHALFSWMQVNGGWNWENKQTLQGNQSITYCVV